MLTLRFADGFGTTARVYTFDGLVDGREHLALGRGGRAAAVSADPEVALLVRIHSECFTGDVLGRERCDCGPQLLEAVRRFAQVGVTVAERVPTAVQPRRRAGAHIRWTSRAMTCSTPRRRARTGRRLLSCHLGRTSRSWWCTVTDRWPAAACARRRLAYDGAWARSSGRCLHAPASQPVNHATASGA